MKRVKSGCIMQTLVFSQKPELGLSKEQSLRVNHQEFDHYKFVLARSKTRHQIIDVDEQADGSIVVRVKKQLNSVTDVSEYFN